MTAVDTDTQPVHITEPCVRTDISDADYHRQTWALSSSMARAILDPGCPAKMRHEQLAGPTPSTDAQEFGSAYHTELLGTGAEVVVVEADSWKGGPAQAARKEARARGAVPLLARQYAEVQAMVAVLRKHKTAGAIFEPGSFVPEQSLFWQDEKTGVWLRARLDATKPVGVFDPKSTVSCYPEDVSRTIAKYRYHCQGRWYLEGARALGLNVAQRFTLVFQEKVPPFVPLVVPLDARQLEIGHERNRRAIETYARCLKTDTWPGFSDVPIECPLPAYAEIEHDLSFSAASPRRDGW